jgi:hypothetical protein
MAMRGILAAALATATGVAAADVGLTPRVSTLGYGVELSFGVTDNLSIGIASNRYDRSESETVDGISYDFEPELKTLGLLANWHPFGGTFRVTAGAYSNDTEFSLTGKFTAGTSYTVGDNTYVATGTERLNGTLSFDSTAPYIGIGWGGRPGSHFGFSADIGALYQGSPKLKLSGTGFSAADIEQERQQAEDDLQSFKWYPVFAVGLYFRF